MITKVCKRVTNVRGMIGYLMGPGKDRVHTNQHTVAGSVQYAGPVDTELRRQLTADLELHSKLHPTVQIKGGNVYHVVLSLPAEDGQLSDATWSQVATEFMDKMGMTGHGPKATMWTAIRHGLSSEGNDHVHVLVNLVRQDGTRVSLHNDMIRAGKIATELERKYGLRVLTGRTVGGNQQPYNGGEIGRANRAGTEIDRVKLERLVRAAAEASAGEGEFVRRLRAQGVEVRPYRTADEVTGYSVKLPGGQLAYGGGKLARDLSLPALRRRWEQTAAAQRSARNEWVKGRTGQPVTKYGVESRANMPAAEKVTAELAGLREQIANAQTPEQIREASRQLSGALAAGAQVDPALAKPAREIAAWAPRAGSSRRFKMASVTMALLVASQGTGRTADLILVKQIVDTLGDLYRLHRMRAQAAHITRTTNQKGAPMTTPDDGMDEVLEGSMTTATVAVAAGVQQLAQIGQDRLVKEAEVRGNRPPVGKSNGTTHEPQSDGHEHTGPQQGVGMTAKQEQTLGQIAGRAGLDVTELRLDDIRYGPDLTVDQAARMIDGLGDPRYGSTGDRRHVLAQIRKERGAPAPGSAAAAIVTSTAAPVAAASTAQQYARTPKQQGPGAGKNTGQSPKF